MSLSNFRIGAYGIIIYEGHAGFVVVTDRYYSSVGNRAYR